ncbi:non-ribosomal peptide synthetase [Chitinophaga nivalis]|uniref:Amino acid adenylation domain-containing protein n=1 Tax=Chitinophaga nivalis TaxID=2991709 RepID=A0ABT3IJ38_9BACT|nr:non-ribosomal peptide synthetase [Chitinophaga nivalis]MCW3466345.1 amino acid adenylation domain-containing protein [Chitinophaga nivalis]MCW3483964.1 amino acid adenylation domain-containing protein [Chitinophaga nivalis]
MNALEIITVLKSKKVVPRLDGDQLKLIGETGNLSTELIAQLKAAKHELVAYLKASMELQLTASPILPVPVQERYPASNAQKRIWLLSQFEGGTAAYNIVTSLYLKGTVIAGNLDKAFNSVVQRHESLRTVFIATDGEPQQVILEEMAFAIAYEDYRQQADVKSAIQTAVEQLAAAPMDLEKGPLIKVQLFRLSDDEYAMVFSVHHIISDGWSVGVLVQEVMRLYEDYCRNGAPTSVEPLRIHYKDYTQWLDQRISSDRGRQAKDFWQQEFPVTPEPINLPMDFPRPDFKSFDGAVAKFYLDTDLYNRIQVFCKQQQVTPFNFFRSALTILLHKLSGQNTVVIGTPVSGRNHVDLETQIGLFVNTIPLKGEVIPTDTFTGFLKNISAHSFRAFEFQDYPLDRVIEDLQIKRDTSRNPLFDVMMVLQNTAIGDGTLNIHKQYGFDLLLLDRYLYPAGRPVDEKRAAKFDLNFNFDTEPGNRFYLEIEYAIWLFKRPAITRLYEAYMYLITQVLEQPEKIISELEITTPVQKQEILQVFNKKIGDITTTSIPALLAPAFRQHAEKTALIFGDNTWSYAELDRLSGSIATGLHPLIQAGDNAFVGLLLERSEWMLLSILGILKAGGAYVPVDTRYPASRIQYMLADARLNYLVVDDAGLALIPADYTGKVIHIRELQAWAAQPPAVVVPATGDLREAIAYLIYTSGSTGRPKGVEICHRNTIAFLQWAVAAFADTPFDVLYATTSYCFDLSVFEFFFPLLEGKTIRLLSSALQIPDVIGNDQQVMINTVPSVVRSLLDEGMDWRTVSALNMAGEPIPRKLKQELDYDRIAVRNLYGPSEDTTYSTVYRFERDNYAAIPIGTPIADTHLYILDAAQHLVPQGVEGEIYLSGQGVAKGYCHQPELTAEKFLDNPFVPGWKMYKTGDIGKWLPDGKVLFSGRIDDQVKVRGYRIELGEIQFLLEQHPQVEEAVVVVRKLDGEHQIAAYWVSGDTLEPIVLKEYLAQHLPAYMVPAYWMQLPAIPLNSNGKVDKKALPDPVAGFIQTVTTVPPVNELQSALLDIWQEVLQTTDLGITHNFFEAGGHSLKAAKLKAWIARKLEKDISLNEIFQYPTVEKQAAIIATRSATAAVVIEPVAIQASYPISFSQERLWVLNNFEEASRAYNMPAAFRVEGNLHLAHLETAFQQVIARHEILRTVFAATATEPVQIVQDATAVPFHIEVIHIDHILSAADMLQLLREKWHIVFDLEKGPLLHCFLLQTPDSRILSFNMHHIISDGWSITVLFRDVMTIYRQLVAGRDGHLPPLPLQYKDFAAWQRKLLQEEPLQASRQYWQEIFREPVPALELPADFPRPDVKTYHGASWNYTFKQSLTTKLRQLSAQNGVSLFMTLMAAVNVLLKKYTGQQDIVTGTPAAGRDLPQLQDQIGFYVNTLAIRTAIDPAAPFRTLLLQQRDTLLQAFEHQHFPFEMLVEELQLKRNLSRSPLFDVMVVLQNIDGLQQQDMKYITPDLQFDAIALAADVAKYDLTFTFAEGENGLQLSLEYNTDLFKAATIRRIGQHLAKLMDVITTNPDIAVKEIVLQDEEEQLLLASRADQTKIGYDQTATIISLFQQAVQQYPDHIALEVGDIKLSYRELDIRSGQLAYLLQAAYGVKAEALVLLHFERSEWMLIAILAVLKAGAAYVPVDPAYPAARINYIMEDSGSRLLLFDTPPAMELQTTRPGHQFVDITALEDAGEYITTDIRPEQAAYVIYTSGTTGNPKGVVIEHRNVVRLLHNEQPLFDFKATDRWSLFHSYCFDFSVWEMYGALLYGGTVVMVPKVVAQDGLAFFSFLHTAGITVLNQTPTAFRSLVQQNQSHFSRQPLAVRYLIFGGEALMPSVLREWHAAYPACRNINMYGITETTVHVTYKEITATEIAADKSNIGVPIPTLSCYVLDADLQQVPVGVIGELCVGGAGVARGYLNRPALTAERFIPHPLHPEEKLYRSGDYARILPTGDMEYIGRRDDQVKIRGHRVEVAEVAAVVAKQPGVKDAVVVTVKNAGGEHDLVAYFIPDTSSDHQQLHSRLYEALPAYMVPSYLVALPAFPLNSNGKLDKAALPAPSATVERQTLFVPCRNETDKQIVAIWENILGKEGIGIRDNFFDLGGHSLKATRVVSRINEVYGIRIDLKNLFIDPTVEHLSDYIDAVQWMDNQDTILTGEQDEMIL